MNKILIWAHRGASGYAPENTLEAFQKAIDLQADGIELDLQLTKDGKLVVIHDETLHRLCGVKGWVKDYTYDELRTFRIKSNFSMHESTKIPTLQEVLDLIKNSSLTVNIEIKNGIVFYEKIEELTLQLVKDMEMQERIVFSSFNHYSMVKLKKLDNTVKAGLLYSDGFIDMPEYAIRNGINILHPALYNLQYSEFINKCKSENISLNVWTVNETEHMKMLLNLEVNAMITDYPDVARKIMEEINGEK